MPFYVQIAINLAAAIGLLFGLGAYAPGALATGAVLAAEGASLGEVSYARQRDGEILQYSGILRMAKPAVLHALADRLPTVEGLVECELDGISK